MPIFEYKCNECGKEFEELVFGNDSQIKCPDCKSSKTSKMLSVFSASVQSSSGGGGLPCGQGDCSSGGFT